MTAPASSASPVNATGDQHAVIRGLGFVLVAMVLLPAQDAIGKYVAHDVSPGMISWARFAVQTGLTVPVVIYFYGFRGLRPNRPWANVMRGALIALSSLLFFYAIKYMPLADALAIFFVEPFLLIVLSAFFEKERVGLRQGIAVAAGFLGVLMVVRPSYDVFGPLSLVPAVSGFVFAIYVLMNRRLASQDHALTMQFAGGASALLFLTGALLVGQLAGLAELLPSVPAARELTLLLLMGILGAGGHFMFLQASRFAPSSIIAPLQYVEIVCAAVFGYLLFGDFPDPWSWAGIVIIVASGAYVFWREAVRR